MPWRGPSVFVECRKQMACLCQQTDAWCMKDSVMVEQSCKPGNYVQQQAVG